MLEQKYYENRLSIKKAAKTMQAEVQFPRSSISSDYLP